MKKSILKLFLFFTFLYGVTAVYAGTNTGIYDWNIYMGGQRYYLNNTSGDGGSSFNGRDLGNQTNMYINEGRVYTWKNPSSGNVCGATIYYRVYMQGTTAPSYSSFTLSFNANLTGGNPTNQRWQNNSVNINMLAGITQPGTYNIDIYASYSGDDGSSGGCGNTYTISTSTATFTWGNTYYWIGGSTSGWNTSGAWSTSLGGASAGVITPSSSNVYIFDGSNLGGGYTGAVTATQGSLGAAFTVAKITLKNGANITYQPSASGYNITISGGMDTDFDIPASSKWTSLPSDHTITLSSGATASISGDFTMGSGSTGNLSLIGTSASSITFNSGGTCTLKEASGQYPFGQGTNGSVIFASGSTMYHYISNEIFGGTSHTVVTFQSGSNYEYSGSSASNLNFMLASTTDRTYANVTFNNTGAVNAGNFSNNITMDSFIVKSTCGGNITFQDVGHTMTIKGNLSNWSATRTLTWDPGTGTHTINFSGTATQTIYNINGSNSRINFGNTSASRVIAVNVTNGAYLRMGNGTISGNFQLTSRLGVASNTTFTVKNGATLEMGTNTITGSSSTNGGTFVTEAGSTLKMGSTAGIVLTTNASPLTGNVQTEVRTFDIAGNYEYNGISTPQVTGDALPATVNNLTINNSASSGIVQVTNSGGTQINGILYLKAATLDVNAKTITMKGNGTTNSITVTGARSITNSNASEAYINVPSTATNLSITSSSGTSLSIGTKVELRIQKGVDFGSSFTTVNDTFRIKNGGYVPTSGYPPTYSSTSTLIYDCGCNYTSNNGSTKEWYENTTGTGPGVPYHVMIKAGSSLNFAATTYVHEMQGNLTIGESAGSASSFILSTGSGDFNIGGHWTRNQQGLFTHNNNGVTFFGATGNQVITVTGGGTETFSRITVNKSGGGNVQFSASPNLTNVASAKASGDAIQLLYGGIDLNGDTLTLSGSGGNIYVANGTRTITGAANSTLIISGNTGVISKTVTNASGGKLVTDLNVKVQVSTGVDFGNLLTTINGSLQMNANAYVNAATSSAPYYGTSSTLIYNTQSNFTSINSNTKEWYENSFGTSAGVPNNVVIKAGSSLNFGTTAYPHEMQGSLTIGEASGSTSTLTLSTTSGGDLNVGGSWTRNTQGIFVHNNREVVFNGSNDATLTANGGEDFAYMVLNKSALAKKLTLASHVRIADRIKFTRGTLDLSTNGKFLTLLSTATKTAQVGVSSSTNSAFNLGTGHTGQFIIQRYVPAKRAWRLMSPPVSGSNATISQAWQEGQAFDYASTGTQASDSVSTGFATQITGGSIVNGFDLSATNNPSIKYYNNGAWLNPANTNATSVKSKEGWMLFVRGDRKNFGQITNQYKTPTITTLRPRGGIFVGQKRFPSSGTLTGLQVVGNPFASAFDFHSAYEATKTANGGTMPYADKYYMWDPNLGGLQGVGAFVTYSWNGSSYDRTSAYGPINIDDSYIPSGAAFFVDFGATGGYLLINESDKTNASTTKAFRPSANVRTNLLSVEPNGTTFISDGVLNVFNENYNNEVDQEDATKLINIEGENFSTKRNGTLLAIEKRKLPQASDTIFYNWSKVKIREYQLAISTDSLQDSWLNIYLEDNYKKSVTPVSLTDTTRYNFKIVREDSGTFKADRFRLIMKYDPPAVATIDAYQQYSDIAVQWQVVNEKPSTTYVIERSADGINFAAVGIIKDLAPSGANIYQWIDTKPAIGNNFYRIQGVGTGGKTFYSTIAVVTIGQPQISVYPNPVTNGEVGIQITNMPEGKYDVLLVNNLGQAIVKKVIMHPGGNGAVKIPLATVKTRGVYQVQIIKPDRKKEIVKVVY